MAEMEKIQDTSTQQIDRLQLVDPEVSDEVIKNYLASPDILDSELLLEIPYGYKKCGGCHKVMKYFLFNINSASRNKCTGNCKACQKVAASKSYEKTKGNRDYKKYYAENKDMKREHGRKYYENNKEVISEKQKEYRLSHEGRSVMHKSHKKRRGLLGSNKGVPYTKAIVIDRDKLGGDFPICYICDQPITEPKDIHLDHFVPVVLGGLDCFTNIGAAHQQCNLRRPKDARDLSVDKIEELIERAERYIDEHPALFEK